MTWEEAAKRVEQWRWHGLPGRALSAEERAAVIDFADWFEECAHSAEELATLEDAHLVNVAYCAMAAFARGAF